MHILFYTKYTNLAASSRLRSYQYFGLLQKNGCKITVLPLFNDRYLKEIYEKKSINKLNILKQYTKRLYSLLFISKYDLVVIEKELFPYFPAFIESALNILGIKYIVDYDDAIFHNYDKSNNVFIRLFLKNKIDIVMRSSALTVVGNEYLQLHAFAAKAKKTFLLPTVIDKNKYTKKDTYNDEKLIIGWIGSPTSLKYLNEIRNVLITLSAEFDFTIHIIGGKSSIGLPEFEKIIEWSETTEVDEIKKFDIGIMPLKDSDWERGKCAYKLIQCMACGVAVIGSNIGANAKVIKDGYNGFLAESEPDWYRKLKILLSNKSLRLEFGDKGYETVMNNYTLQSVFDKYYEELQSVN